MKNKIDEEYFVFFGSVILDKDIEKNQNTINRLYLEFINSLPKEKRKTFPAYWYSEAVIDKARSLMYNKISMNEKICEMTFKSDNCKQEIIGVYEKCDTPPHLGICSDIKCYNSFSKREDVLLRASKIKRALRDSSDFISLSNRIKRACKISFGFIPKTSINIIKITDEGLTHETY